MKPWPAININSKTENLSFEGDVLYSVYSGTGHPSILQPQKTIIEDHYQQQLMQLNCKLKVKQLEYSRRHNIVVFQHFSDWLHAAITVKVTLKMLIWDVLSHLFYFTHLAILDYCLFQPMQNPLSDKHFSSFEDVFSNFCLWGKKKSCNCCVIWICF